MSLLIHFHPSPDLQHPIGPPLSLMVRLHPCAAPTRPTAGRASLSRLVQTLRTAVGLSPELDAPLRNRSLPPGIRAPEIGSQPAHGGSQGHAGTVAVGGGTGVTVTQVRTPVPTVAEDKPVPVAPKDFASLFCAAHRIRPRKYIATILRQTLRSRGHRFTGSIVRFLPWLAPCERAFLIEVGGVRSVEQYAAAEEHFLRWPLSHSFLRRTLGVRVSTTRVRGLVVGLFPGSR